MNHIKLLRVTNDLTQLQLQMKTGIDKGVLSNYEVGRTMPTIYNLMILADFYKTSLDYLMDRTDVKEPYTLKKQPE